MSEWRKAAASVGNGNCVEVKFELDGSVGVRDSKDPGARGLTFSLTEWAAFIEGVKAGEFDR